MKSHISKSEKKAIDLSRIGLIVDLDGDDSVLNKIIANRFKQIEKDIIKRRQYLDHLSIFEFEKKKIKKILSSYNRKMRFKNFYFELLPERQIKFSSEMEPIDKYSRSHFLYAFEGILEEIGKDISKLEIYGSKKVRCSVGGGSCNIFGTIDY